MIKKIRKKGILVGRRRTQPGIQGSQAPWGTPRIRAEERKNHGARVEAGWGKRRERRVRIRARSQGAVCLRRTGIGESRGRMGRDRMKKMGDPLTEIPQLNAGENPAPKISV